MSDARTLDTLHPTVRAMARRLLAEAAAAGMPLTVTFTTRSPATQAALYAQGRTAPGPIVTNARPGQSFHEYGLALDVVPTELLGLPDWGDRPPHRAHAATLWAKLAKLGTAIGFTWGGDFTHLPDRPHFEWSGGLTLAQLRAGARPPVPPPPPPSR